MDKKHSLLHERIQGREAELKDPQLRAALITQLSEETHIHPDFIDGFVEALGDPNSVPFETRKTRNFLPSPDSP